jgi:hypothetical protein
MNKNGERHARTLSSNPIEILQQQLTQWALDDARFSKTYLGLLFLSEGTMN